MPEDEDSHLKKVPRPQLSAASNCVSATLRLGSTVCVCMYDTVLWEGQTAEECFISHKVASVLYNKLEKYAD